MTFEPGIGHSVRVRTISSRHNPMVSAFRELAESPDRAGARMLLDGVHLVREALDSPVELEVVAIAESQLAQPGDMQILLDTVRARGIEVVTVSDTVLRAMSPVRTPAGVVAVGRRTPIKAAEICRNPLALIVVAVDVQDPGNVGSLIRSAEAGGATGVLVCGSSANPFGWKALRGSMGSALRLPVACELTANEALSATSAANLRLIATVPRGGFSPDDLDWTDPCAVFVGGEGHGLPNDIADTADVRVSIPMSPCVESLNVAVTAALLVYAAREQRQ